MTPSPIWFSPVNVVYHASQLNQSATEIEKKTKKFRKVVETYMVAIMVTGMTLIDSKQYWLQLVEDKEQSPDVRTVCKSDILDPKFDNMDYQDVEVVGYNSTGGRSLPEFLATTKFSGLKAYDNKTYILGYMSDDQGGMSLDDLSLAKEMASFEFRSPTLFVAASTSDRRRYRLLQLAPEVCTLVEFDLEEELIKLGQRPDYVGVLNLKRGSRRPATKNPADKHYPFERLGYLPNEDGSYC